MKKTILENLPRGFKCYVSNDGLTINLHAKLDKVGGFDNANKSVKKLCKAFNFDEIDSETMLDTMERDWELIDLNVERKMHAEAQSVLKHMKTFFNKYANHYCSSSKTYDVIEKMRSLIETDEA